MYYGNYYHQPMKEQLMYKKEKQSLYFTVAPKVWGTKDVFVNMYMVQNPADGHWVLIDTGLKSSASKIKRMAADLFGPDSKPEAIILTHGHFDHVGSLAQLADEWNVPIYAHYLELPYLSGKSSYPPADPTVGGGVLSKASWLYPNKPIDVVDRLHIVPPDGSVPFLPDWQYIHTPGHAPGHISLFRRRDKVLIAGDAFVTTRQESVLSVMFQSKKLSGPPKYLTYDWEAAGHSVKNLANLDPSVVATGHGKPMRGIEMQIALTNLAVHFEKEAVPKKGRYVTDPALIDASGIRYLPPKPPMDKKPLLYLFIGVALGAAAIVLASDAGKKKKKRNWL